MSDTSDVDRIATILVGLDGSHESERAASFTASLARQLGADVVAAHAVGLLDVWPEHPESSGERNSHVRVAALFEGPWTEPLRPLGARLRLILRDGPPSIALLEIGDEVDADVIVIGSRGAGRAELFGLGSTSASIAQRSSRPVIVVPTTQPPDSDDSSTHRKQPDGQGE